MPFAFIKSEMMRLTEKVSLNFSITVWSQKHTYTMHYLISDFISLCIFYFYFRVKRDTLSRDSHIEHVACFHLSVVSITISPQQGCWPFGRCRPQIRVTCWAQTRTSLDWQPPLWCRCPEISLPPSADTPWKRKCGFYWLMKITLSWSWAILNQYLLNE